jgi:cytidine deaminase
MADELFQAALAAAHKSYSPYSQFPVGAALITADGRVHSGCNIESASYPEGWCAETTAISHMIMDGGGEIAEIAVLGLKADLCTPCGGCRQRLAEFGSANTKVHLCNQSGIVETVTLGELLPKSFSIRQDR